MFEPDRNDGALPAAQGGRRGWGTMPRGGGTISDGVGQSEPRKLDWDATRRGRVLQSRPTPSVIAAPALRLDAIRRSSPVAQGTTMTASCRVGSGERLAADCTVTLVG